MLKEMFFEKIGKINSSTTANKIRLDNIVQEMEIQNNETLLESKEYCLELYQKSGEVIEDLNDDVDKLESIVFSS